MPRKCPIFAGITICHIPECPGITKCPAVKRRLEQIKAKQHKEGEANA